MNCSLWQVASTQSENKQTNKQTQDYQPIGLDLVIFHSMYCNYAAAATQMFLSTVLIICVTLPPTGKI